MKHHSLLFGYRVRVLFAVGLLFCVAGFSVHKATQARAAAENSGTVSSRVEPLSQSDARPAADVELAASFSGDAAILTHSSGTRDASG